MTAEPVRAGSTTTAASAYSLTGGAWQRGPGRIYDRLAEVVVEHAPVPVAGASALDAGAGTGAASRALTAAGARRVVAMDVALGMLAHDAATRPPAVVGDLVALPFSDGCFDVVIAAFSLNHVRDSGQGLRELARVTGPGGGFAAAAYADDDTHPVKGAMEAALADRGWELEPWYVEMREHSAPALGSVDAARSVAAAAGIRPEVRTLRVPFPELGVPELVEWRLGMAQHATFLAGLSDAGRRELVDDVVARLGDDCPTLVRSMILLSAVRT